jgi:hypothetical protein
MRTYPETSAVTYAILCLPENARQQQSGIVVAPSRCKHGHIAGGSCSGHTCLKQYLSCSSRLFLSLFCSERSSSDFTWQSKQQILKYKQSKTTMILHHR